jgi:hypothetical protein
MNSFIPWLACSFLLAVPATGLAQLPPLVARAKPESDAKLESVHQIARIIDRHLSADWADRKIVPTTGATDAEFARRAYLDLIGRIPKVSEVRAFEEDTAKDKRLRLVEKLLQAPTYASHFASATRNAWMPETQTDIQTMYLGQQYEDWLRRRFAENQSLDEIVRRTLTAEVYVGQRGRLRNPNNQPYDAETASLGAFYQVNQSKPENLGSTVSRAFLGIKLECAQCHDHPFAPYKRTQFWEFAAFFGEFTALSPLPPNFVGPLEPQTEKNVLTIPGTQRTVTAKFMDQTSPTWKKERGPRLELADWITSRKNPYFAKNLANRLWAHFFGIGLIDPIDEPGDENPPSHPELLNDLAEAYKVAKFDQRVMIRGIMASQAYNLSSKQTDPSQADVRRFARMNVKSLTGSQIYNSFVAATGVREGVRQQYVDPYGQNQRSLFRIMFPNSNRPTETQTSILQALMMMNGKAVAEQTSLDKSEILAAIIDAPFLDSGKKIDVLFQTALTRKPTPEEREKLASYVDRGGPSGDKAKALSDVFWVLLNSTEFLFNH